jgi:phage tail-like protein
MATGMSRYLDLLPAFVRDDLARQPFLGEFLLAFERILTGLAAPRPPDPVDVSVPLGLEQILDAIETFFDPALAPAELLPWLSSWVATSLREDWDTATRRSFIANIVPLYRQRGTPAALRMMLQIFLNPDRDPQRDASDNVEVLEAPKVTDPDYTPGQAFPPRYFQVRFQVVERDPAVLARRAAIATDLIDREKPAHTYYGLRISFPSLEIADPPTFDGHGFPLTGVFVGTNTTLGNTSFSAKE